MRKKAFSLVFFLLHFSCLASGRPISQESIPEILKPWQGWVLHGQEQRLHCIPDFNAETSFNCIWPSSLTLDFLPTSGFFQQKWTAYTDNSWLQLPGDKRFWPDNVTINEQPALVVEREGIPFILAAQGSSVVKGTFHWQDLPESFQVPAASAQVSVTINHAPMDHLTLDSSGRLWLRSNTPPTETKNEDSLTLQVFRRINDTIPPQVDIHLEIQAGGARREINLGSLFPMNTFSPLTLSSTLPAKLEKNGELVIQIRPGQWVLDLSLRHKGQMKELAFVFPTSAGWPKSEIWSFQDQPSFRMVKIEGVPAAIDPSQSNVPSAWQSLPAYLLTSGEKLLFNEIKRGEPNPPPDQLQLNRELWLNFDGSGYFVRDTISGSKHNSWRFSTFGNRLELGRVTLDGHDQLITTMDNGASSGVEIRQGEIAMTAVSTLTKPVAKIPASGYDKTFQSVSVKLHLPPGFSLFNLTGVENVYGTWVGSWTLLDLFLLCITTISCFKVFGTMPSLICLTTLVLLYHQSGAPLWGWLNIIFASALLRVIQEGKFKTILQTYKNVSLLIVVIVSIPFMVNQLRHGLYPQLERPYQAMEQPPASQAPPAPASSRDAGESVTIESQSTIMTDKVASPAKMKLDMQGRGVALESTLSSVAEPSLANERKLEQFDPDAKIQTGPGLPTWHWNQISIPFNGPVTKDQTLQITVLTPAANLALAVGRCLAILLLLWAITGGQWPPSKRKLGRVAVAITFFILPALTPPAARAIEIPSPELLQELEQRLLEPQACFPDCVSLDTLAIRQEGESLVFSLDVSAYEKTAVPLPSYLQQWQPERVWFPKDKSRAPDLLRKGDTLWIVVDKGQTTIEIQPRLDKQLRSLQINMPLIPHRLKTSLPGWTVSGVDSANTIPTSLTLTRIPSDKQAAEQGPELRTGALPPFFSVERTLRLGLTWQVETVIRRLTPADSAMVVTLPLIKSESVLTDGIAVKDGSAELVFSQQTDILQFSSSLEIDQEITLLCAQTDLYTETWKIDPSPIWHVEYLGPPVISQQTANRWLPTWQPWPGESIKLTITRPQAVAGPVKTIDISRLTVEPGSNATNVSLAFVLRASQGGQHSIKIPAAAESIQKFEINGRKYPLQKDPGGRLLFPVNPGEQEVKLEWTEANPITIHYSTPAIDLGLPSVNSHLTMKMGRDRWPLLLYGPQMGPAVLWWTFIAITFLASFGLARITTVPLRFHQWFLLGVGMLQTNLLLPVVFTLWLVGLGKRKELPPGLGSRRFNAIQFLLAILTIAALNSLVRAISNGLLGYPNMQIIGNGSSNILFQWYQDIALSLLPQGHVVSVPLWVYRVFMLAWALWMSFTLVRLLKWAWLCISTDKLWISTPWRKTKGEKSADIPTTVGE